MTTGSNALSSAVYAIIPAAGTGSRMKMGVSKQFLTLGRYPVIIRTLMAMDAHPQISGYVVVAAAGDLAAMKQLIAGQRLSRCLAVVAGGETRQDSVAAGLLALAGHQGFHTDSLILVHDGARCFITPDVIDRVIGGVILHQACGAAVPVKDTIKQADAGGRIRQTLERSQLWAMQTPQGARYSLLRRAYDLAYQNSWQATDDLALLELAGHPAYLVPGDYRNIKITTPEDRLLGEQLARLADDSLNSSLDPNLIKV